MARTFFYVSGVLLMFLFVIGGMGETDNAYAESVFPDNVKIEEEFKPGVGHPVGKVQLLQGKAAVIHKNTLFYYWAKKDMPLFEGDTIVTGEKGRIRFELNDGSILTLSSETKLVISQSIYEPISKTRSSFLGMTLGKARFWVKKLVNFKRSDFKVKTKTAVVGVRGSDFIVTADAERTEVTALEKTRLEIISLVGPEADPTVLLDFEQTVIEEGALPFEAQPSFPEDIEILKDHFTITPEGVEETFKPPEEGIFVSDNVPVRPEEPEQIVTTADIIKKDIVRRIEKMTAQSDIKNIENTAQRIMEDIIIPDQPTEPKPLPPFPGEPE
ncbi:FecR domain-containing protein [Desulfonema magnum]|uniref:FecR domain-containing protein n=2 Tax=Desulfonema magnum TaxID=45655 RepID=A0A975BSX6_9BACT|nr:FecR domain-containing protein [Desulfonema magnum]